MSAFDTLLIPETVYQELQKGSVPDAISDLSHDLVEAVKETATFETG